MMAEVPRLRPARRGLALSYHGKTLLSTIDPIAQAEKAASSYTIKPRTLYLVASPLFGYGISLILDSLPADSALFALEVDPALYNATQKEFYRTIPMHIPYINTSSAAELCNVVRNTWGPRRFRRVEMVTLNAGWTLYEELYKELLFAIQQDMAIDWANAMTLTRLGRLYARNTLRNLSTLAHRPSLDQFRLDDLPVLLAGAGPSLDDVLYRLMKAYPQIQDKQKRSFRIICVDTALKSFLARSIPVDVVIALEAQIWNLEDFIGYDRADFTLAMDLSAHPNTVQVAEDAAYFFYTPWTELSFLKRLEQRNLLPTLIPPLGSVGLTATYIALSVTQGPVYIAGLDFSFTPELYHAKSSPGYQRRYCSQTRLQPLSSVSAGFRHDVVKNLDAQGQIVLTDRLLQRYQNLFIREFEGVDRLADLRPWGLDLHIRRGTLEELIGDRGDHPMDPIVGKEEPVSTADVLEVSPKENHKSVSAADKGKSALIRAFLTKEATSLKHLKAILSGEAPAAAGELDRLLDYCDYLWAHFPECAAAGRQRPGISDISFLKRVRAELDYFIKLVELSLTHL